MMFDEDKRDEHEEEGSDNMSADSVDEMLDGEDEDENEDFNPGRGDEESEDRWE